MTFKQRVFQWALLTIFMISVGSMNLFAEESPIEPLSQLIENETALPRKVDFWSSLANGMVVQELKADGKLVGSKESKRMFSKGDIVYIQLSDEGASSNEWILFRKVKKVRHPGSGKSLGDLIEITGALKVLERNGHTATAQIVHSKEAISITDEIAALGTLIPPSPPTEQASLDKKTGVIAEVRDDRLSSGEHDIVYIDQGWKDGIFPGDQFEVLHGNEKNRLGFSGDAQIPQRSVGRLLILFSQEQTATARIISSSEPILRGDALQYLPRNR